ncbi:MAG: hypothetical protein ACXW1W_03175 [Methylococcaceae bacterium]
MYIQTAGFVRLSPTASSSLVYPVKSKQRLIFALPEDSSQLRIITNAHIRRTDALTVNPNWTYALHYELLDKKGTVLSVGVYHQHSQLTTYKDAQGEQVYNNYYANKDLVPLDGRLILLRLQAIKGAAFLRVSLEADNPAIVETAVRVYVPTKISEQQVATSWLRMNQEQKDNLAKNSVYPASLLSVAEQTNLLKNQWQPVGPMGIEGKDYQILTLYTLDDKEIAPYYDVALMLASGLQADAQHYGVIPLPEQGGQLTLTLKALDGSSLAMPVAINLQWFGRTQEQRWQHNVLWSKDTASLNYHLDGGLLVIRPSMPVVIHADLTTAAEAKQDITDSLLSIKTYRASFDVDFDILHFQQHPAVMRIDVRKLLTMTATPRPECLPFHWLNPELRIMAGCDLSALEQPPLFGRIDSNNDAKNRVDSLRYFSRQTLDEPVRYQWLNDQQQIIASGVLRALDQPSLFDRVGSITDPINVSDPANYYFHLPAQVSRVRLLSNNPSLLINAYNQPYDFTEKQRIPEDVYAFSDKQNLQLTWFPLRAVNDKSLMQQLAVQWISGQYRPPEDKPELLAGLYLWEDFIPQGKAVGRYLLTGYTGDEPRTDALASVYCSLTVNHDNQVKLDAFNGLRSVMPELIFLREKSDPFSVELFLNQQKVLSMNLIGQQGIMHSPETALGNQRIRLNTNSGGRWLMNYQAQCAGEKYLKRRVFTLNAEAGLDFMIKHAAEDEILSARLYSPNNTIDRSQIKVDIEAITATAPTATVLTKWTNQKRLYDIRPLPTKAMPILYALGQTLTNGELFAIPINADLPAGAYRVRIALANGPAGLISLSQIRVGVHGQRRFYRETELETH